MSIQLPTHPRLLGLQKEPASCSLQDACLHKQLFGFNSQQYKILFFPTSAAQVGPSLINWVPDTFQNSGKCLKQKGGERGKLPFHHINANCSTCRCVYSINILRTIIFQGSQLENFEISYLIVNQIILKTCILEHSVQKFKKQLYFGAAHPRILRTIVLKATDVNILRTIVFQSNQCKNFEKIIFGSACLIILKVIIF